jgi:hypothetical protein
MKKITKIILIIIGVIIVLFLVISVWSYNYENETLGANEMRLLTGLATPIGQNSVVGVGNMFSSSTYTDETGAEKHGHTVWLSFHNRDNNPKDQRILAHEGQVIKFGDQTIEVVKINISWFLMKDSVVLRILTLKEALSADPNLLYSSQYWAGLCSKDGRSGGCYDELYFFSTGRFVKESGFDTSGNRREPDPTVDKNFGAAAVSQVIKIIKDSGVMSKDCPPEQIMDVGWDHQLNINGVKKSFHNAPAACRDTFDQIDNLLNSLSESK